MSSQNRTERGRMSKGKTSQKQIPTARLESLDPNSCSWKSPVFPEHSKPQISRSTALRYQCESDFTPVAKMIEEDIESWWRYLSSEKVVLPPDWRIPDPHSPFALQVAKAQDPMTSYVKNPPTSTWTIKGPSGEQTWHGSHRREWISHQREWMYGFHIYINIYIHIICIYIYMYKYV